MGHPRIFISVGDVSGDLHGANLVTALKTLAPDAEIVGLGGPKMEAAGARLLANTVEFGVIGVGPIFGSLKRYYNLLQGAGRFVAEWKPDVAVTIDCPGFHFLLARKLKARHIPTVWYIPPQLWAWAAWRVHKLRRRFTHVVCVLPQEEGFFRKHGVPVTFVGHPVVDHLRNLKLDEPFIRGLRSGEGERLVALLPGSRRQEVGSILARQLAVAKALGERHPPCRFVLALAAEEHRAWTTAALAESGLPVTTVVGKTHEVQSAADLALVASGTAALELTYYDTPMAVFYNVTWLQWHLLGKWLVKTPYLSLPNALAGRRIVPEYMRASASVSEMIEECSRLLVDPAMRAQVKADLADVTRRIEKPGTAMAAAKEVLRVAQSATPPLASA
jgi:lipid-A-disaccharide synthase